LNNDYIGLNKKTAFGNDIGPEKWESAPARKCMKVKVQFFPQCLKSFSKVVFS
jgi:hypothetical protein